MLLKKIIKEAINRNEEAFNVIFEEYKYTVFYIAKKYLKNTQDAEECTQDIFNKLWTLIPEYSDAKGNFEAWLITIARNHAIDRYRKLTKEKERLTLNVEIVYNQKEEDDTNTNSYFAILKEILTDKEYEIIVFKFVHNLNFIQISKILNTSRETVRRRYNEIIAKAKAHVGGKRNE